MTRSKWMVDSTRPIPTGSRFAAVISVSERHCNNYYYIIAYVFLLKYCNWIDLNTEVWWENGSWYSRRHSFKCRWGSVIELNITDVFLWMWICSSGVVVWSWRSVLTECVNRFVSSYKDWATVGWCQEIHPQSSFYYRISNKKMLSRTFEGRQTTRSSRPQLIIRLF